MFYKANAGLSDPNHGRGESPPFHRAGFEGELQNETKTCVQQ